MEVMLLLYVDENGWAALSAEGRERAIGAYMAYTEALTDAGVLRGVGRLGPRKAAATVRVPDCGSPLVLDGPYAETKEQLGGYFLIEVAEKAAALDWAARCPAARHGVVEVRPMWQSPA